MQNKKVLMVNTKACEVAATLAANTFARKMNKLDKQAIIIGDMLFNYSRCANSF